jgi:hypothetical protein
MQYWFLGSFRNTTYRSGPTDPKRDPKTSCLQRRFGFFLDTGISERNMKIQNDLYLKFPTTGRVLGGGGFHLKEIVGITGGLDFTLE